MDIKRTDLVYEVSLRASVELLSNQTTDLNFLLSKTLPFYLVQPQKLEKPHVNFNIPNLKKVKVDICMIPTAIKMVKSQ